MSLLKRISVAAAIAAGFLVCHPALAASFSDGAFSLSVTEVNTAQVSFTIPSSEGCPDRLAPSFFLEFQGFTGGSAQTIYTFATTTGSLPHTFNQEVGLPEGSYYWIVLHCAASAGDGTVQWPGGVGTFVDPIATHGATGTVQYAIPITIGAPVPSSAGTTYPTNTQGAGSPSPNPNTPQMGAAPNYFGYTIGSTSGDSNQWIRFTGITPETVTNATLETYCIESHPEVGRDTQLAIFEGKRVINASASWNKYDGSNLWQTAGGTGVNDRYSSFLFEGDATDPSLNCNSTPQLVDIPLDPALVEAAIADGELTLHVEADHPDTYIAFKNASTTLIINSSPGTAAADPTISVLPYATSTSIFGDTTVLCDHLGTTSTFSFVGVDFGYWFPTGGGVVDCTVDIARYLFVPTQTTVNRLGIALTSISGKAPFGYASQIASSTTAIFADSGTSSTQVYLTIPAGDMNGHATQTMNLFNTATIEEKAGPLIDPIRTTLSILLWMGFLFGLYEFAVHHQKP